MSPSPSSPTYRARLISTKLALTRMARPGAQRQSGVASSTTARGVYFLLVGPREDRSVGSTPRLPQTCPMGDQGKAVGWSSSHSIPPPAAQPVRIPDEPPESTARPLGN